MKKVSLFLLPLFICFSLFLFLKVVVVKQLYHDMVITKLASDLMCLEKLKHPDEERVLRSLVEGQIIVTWNSLESGSMRSHPGREIWLYRIESALNSIGGNQQSYPLRLSDRINNLHQREKPEVEREYYGAANNPLLRFWP